MFLLASDSRGQGTFVYDQQSSDESFIAGGIPIQTSQPLGQSFTPNLSAAGFIRLFIYDLSPSNGIGATLYVTLRTNSIAGPILGSTDPVSMSDNFSGVTNFVFGTEVTLVPGVTYYFQPVVQSGDGWGIAAYNAYNYPGGTEFYQGAAFPNNDLWFREGIVIPEPSTFALTGVGLGMLALSRHRRRG